MSSCPAREAGKLKMAIHADKSFWIYVLPLLGLIILIGVVVGWLSWSALR
jgi:hypothetical protein